MAIPIPNLSSGPALSGQGDFLGGGASTGPLYMGRDRIGQIMPLIILGAVAWVALRRK